ncbi:MAG: metal-dependent transcriptional regulator [Cytophagales bacterium]|jgi:DtxR family Mn-dependent transcriptional regulator|nr:metal-dependent transcriptional regulator [Cytophagales bacterium]MCA6387325.1 metal-dependent transcriptional regulator [Cytophagales bacterium]MCA6390134.1 metal-dependent transcriptional regulator [Cytophagales bacterium]MCA6393592.1 metal-dependent transcriptional regulator [Cytophagales bacterium]MCA6397836.1 metal-dependent transcriptional regulator [Cytophagales bacterium]
MISLAEENYLKSIYHLSQAGSQSVLTNELAEAMNTKAASVTDMIKKLSTKEFISYEKYYGVNLTTKGKVVALSVIRKHRLWETFLVEKLGFSWDEVHEVAEQLEHIQSKRLIEKLDEYLGFPKVDPHGDPIPDTNGKIKALQQVMLASLKPGAASMIVAVKDSDSQLLKYLDKIGARPGKTIKVIEREEYDGSMEVSINNQRFFLSKEVSENILVNA